MPAFERLGLETPGQDLDALRELVRRVHDRDLPDVPAHVVEVGSWAGRTALAMANTGLCRVWCVDTWQGSPGDVTRPIVESVGHEEVFRTFLRNVGPLAFNRIVPCPGPSLFWASVWPFPVDLVFLDADHDYEAVEADIAAWAPHVRPGGILCGHDYGGFEGVTRAVDEFGKDGVLGLGVWWKQR